MTSLLEPVPSFVDPEDSRLRTPANWIPLQTKASDRTLKLLILLSAVAAVWYLGWLFQPARVGNPYLYALLATAELFNIVQAMGFWWTLAGRSKNRDHTNRVALDPSTTVDVFIPTYSEPVEVVEATVASARALNGYDTKVWILDDGDRSSMADLAKAYGVGYITREEHKGAKAGNINHALGVTNSQYVVVLDCDHVPLPHFLEATLPDFRDDKVAFVQTPQYYANYDESPIAANSWSQQAIFFGAIAQGKEKHGAMFCTGTNVVFRREALQSIGGFPTNSLTEDFELSIHLNEQGWKSTYVDETLAAGLGPEDMASYVSQQHRWARGCLSALPRIIKAKLPVRQRLQYLLSSLYFLTGFTLLVYMVLPVLSIFFDLTPLASVSSDQFLLHFAPYYALCLYTLTRASQGSFTFGAFALAQASFWIQMHACYRWIFRRPSKFVVTPKQGSSDRQPRAVAPALVMIAILLGAVAYGMVTNPSPGTLNNVAFALMHVTVLAVGVWPALVKGQGKLSPQQVVDLRKMADKPHLALVPSTKA